MYRCYFNLCYLVSLVCESVCLCKSLGLTNCACGSQSITSSSRPQRNTKNKNGLAVEEHVKIIEEKKKDYRNKPEQKEGYAGGIRMMAGI